MLFIIERDPHAPIHRFRFQHITQPFTSRPRLAEAVRPFPRIEITEETSPPTVHFGEVGQERFDGVGEVDAAVSRREGERALEGPGEVDVDAAVGGPAVDVDGRSWYLLEGWFQASRGLRENFVLLNYTENIHIFNNCSRGKRITKTEHSQFLESRSHYSSALGR